MVSRFSPGATVYGKDGRSYTVEAVDGGTVYCTASNGAETEFPEATLFTEAEWAERAAQSKHGKREVPYPRLKQSRHYASTAAKVTAAASEQLLSRVGRLMPSLLDFVAFAIASDILTETHDDDLIEHLSIVKCRQIFDGAPLQVRAALVARVLAAQPEALVSAAGLGDNLVQAMVTKGLEPLEQAYEDFQDRPRR
ncbi:MAG: hypothetical protein LCH56_07065 [Proteobacteria bacterium]|nr:hypothetical protein [Pseudomonadota bacterium]